jgi:hypothetical protein
MAELLVQLDQLRSDKNPFPSSDWLIEPGRALRGDGPSHSRVRRPPELYV